MLIKNYFIKEKNSAVDRKRLNLEKRKKDMNLRKNFLILTIKKCARNGDISAMKDKSNALYILYTRYSRTVVHPIGDWIYRNATFENILLISEHHSGHVSTIAPSPDADSSFVKILVRL